VLVGTALSGFTGTSDMRGVVCPERGVLTMWKIVSTNRAVLVMEVGPPGSLHRRRSQSAAVSSRLSGTSEMSGVARLRIPGVFAPVRVALILPHNMPHKSRSVQFSHVVSRRH
jgi:hypothetical protein